MCPICIDKERMENQDYGTRTSTVIVVNHNNECIFIERNRYDADWNLKTTESTESMDATDVRFQFSINF